MADQSTGSHHPIQPELVPAPAPEGDDANDDNDSAIGSTDSARSSTASLASSILNYRTFHGRTYHSDRYNVEYWTPNDEQQLESVDISHHYLNVILDNRLYLAPIKKDIQKAVDIGTGTGIWAIDFADEFPNTEVIGTDISPVQPSWVPPNLKFEIENATEQWTWPDNTFDFVHIRYLFGAVSDWDFLCQQAYRCCKPGGWVESVEIDPIIYSDDNTTKGVYAVERWNELFREAGKKTGRSFMPVKENILVNAVKDAGFVDRHQADYKVPLSPWAADKKLKEVGQFAQFAMTTDLEGETTDSDLLSNLSSIGPADFLLPGYTMHLWHNVMNWSQDEYQVFLMSVRKFLNNRSVHGYMSMRYVYGRKSE